MDYVHLEWVKHVQLFYIVEMLEQVRQEHCNFHCDARLLVL